MFRYVARRIAVMLVMLWALSLVVFLILNVVPGDAATVFLGLRSDPELLEKFRREYGLYDPIHVRYLTWFGGLFRGTMGKSFATGNEVGRELVGRLPVTLELTFLAMLFGVAFAIPAGIFAARRRNTAPATAVTVAGLVGLSIPNFWLGTLLVLVFAVWLRWVPSGGYVPFIQNPVENLRLMILPALSLGLINGAVLMRMTRSSMLEVLQQDYVRTARAKGATERVVIWRHALRNALVPVITIMGLEIGYIFGGAVLIETIFLIPGVGSYAYLAVEKRDYAQLQSAVVLIGAVFMTVNLVVDLLYTTLDPRQRTALR